MRGDYQYVSISTVAGDNTLAPALAGHRIRVVSCVFSPTTVAQEVQFESGTSVALTGPIQLAPGASCVLPFTTVGWFQTEVGALLNLNTTADVNGCLVYEYIPDVE